MTFLLSFQAASDDEGLKEEETSVTTEARKDDEDKGRAEEVIYFFDHVSRSSWRHFNIQNMSSQINLLLEYLFSSKRAVFLKNKTKKNFFFCRQKSRSQRDTIPSCLESR